MVIHVALSLSHLRVSVRLFFLFVRPLSDFTISRPAVVFALLAALAACLTIVGRFPRSLSPVFACFHACSISAAPTLLPSYRQLLFS